MNFAKAQEEFKIRYYLWATSEFRREIIESFPDERLFKTGAAWQLYQFMHTLDRSDQLVLARSLLKRFHPEAVKALGESCSVEEEFLRDKLDMFRSESEIAALGLARERLKYLSKRKVLKLVAQRFQDAFRDQLQNVFDDGDPLLEFKAKCPGGWIISTHFWFGRGERLIQYDHAISSEITFEHHGPQGPYMGNLVIGSMMSLCDWLGICSQTQWENMVKEEDVDHACDAVMKLSKRFFEVAPKLLKGLEVDTITYP